MVTAQIRRDVLLAPYTTWRIGGPAQFFAEPETEQQLRDLCEWAVVRQLPLTILGRGSNVLITDHGIRGLVICTRSMDADGFALEATDGVATASTAIASAGLSLPRLAKQVAAIGYSGFEFYIGIPGTVGGAIVMNAGFGPGDERQTANRCRAVRVLRLPDGEPEWIAYADLNPAYRHTDLMDAPWLVLAARFDLQHPAAPQQIRDETALHLVMRKTKQPLSRPTAGSVFAAAEGIPAAIYIDRCGLKGLRIGDAAVSPKHANWIENMGNATAADVLALMDAIQARVQGEFGVSLVPEIRILGGKIEA